MSFPGKDPEVLYITVSIKLHISKDMYRGNYVCDVLGCNTGTWLDYDDYTITQYPGYPMNVYDELLIDKKQKNGKYCVWMYQIGLCPWCILENIFLHRSPTHSLQGIQYQNKMNILSRV